MPQASRRKLSRDLSYKGRSPHGPEKYGNCTSLGPDVVITRPVETPGRLRWKASQRWRYANMAWQLLSAVL